MSKFYLVEFWTPSKTERCWNLTRVERRRTFARAIARGEAMLAKHRSQETDYSARLTRLPGVSIRRNGKEVAFVECPIDIVPSVGDLGWTP